MTGTSGNDGVDGADGQSAYEIWISQGNTGTEADFLNGLTGTSGNDGVDGTDGLSAYEIWLSLGNTGTETEFLNGLNGPAGNNGVDGIDGLSAYEFWLSLGNTGTEQDFINGLTGPAGNDGVDGANGLSAYEVWLSLGNTGTEQDFLNGLTGPAGNNGVDGVDGLSAYEVWLSLGNTGTEADFLNGLTGPQGPVGATGPQGPQGDPGSFPNGTNNGDMLYWDGTNWTIVNGASSNNQILTWCDGIPTWTPDGICPGTAQGTINTLDCASAATTGTLIEGQAASGVSVSVPYTGGDGGTHNGQSVSSTGVTGLTATLTSGTFANGSGSLSYTISGTPSTSGSASFALNIGGQSCTITMNVQAGSGSQYPSGTVFCASGPTEIVDVTNPITGKTWMDRNLGASQVAINSTDVDSYGDLYQWGRFSDGHQCRNSPTLNGLSSVDQPGIADFIIPSSGIDWRSPQNDNLWQGVNGINNPCPDGYRLPTTVEFDEERLSWISDDALGAIVSPLKLPLAGIRYFDAVSSTSPGDIVSVGTRGFYWSSSISSMDPEYSVDLWFQSTSANVHHMFRARGLSVRCIKEDGTSQGSINTLDCGTATTTGTLTEGQAASGLSSSVPYTGGDGGTHNGQSVSSTGVTGLTATLTAGVFANGNGSLSYTISGTPSSSGSASFALNIGGQSCTITMNVQAGSGSQYPSGTVFCASGPTEIVEVTNPVTGRTWMDRNLGASQVAAIPLDTNAFGDLYQWGRLSDGHQCRNSINTSVLSQFDQPGHGMFITRVGNPWDWRYPEQNDDLWQGLNGTNNPCPDGFRVPTMMEWVEEQATWSDSDAINTILKLPSASNRNWGGSLNQTGPQGVYWSSTIMNVPFGSFVGGSYSEAFSIYPDTVYFSPGYRVYALSVRCIKEESAIQGAIYSIDCNNSHDVGTLVQGESASGVYSTIPYRGGNGYNHNGQVVNSTGVAGLVATLSPGNFFNGTDSLTYLISGTPNSSGTASFAIDIGGQTCNLMITVHSVDPLSQYPVNSIFCNDIVTGVFDVLNPSTGKIWMDRNLGAQQIAQSYDDVNSYGDLYQWGRGSDGHQCRNSGTTTSTSSSDSPPHGDFIDCWNSPYDWRTPENNSLWQGLNGINNPCPIGYRLPTDAEFESERLSWTSNNGTGAFNSPLKLTMSGSRGVAGANITDEGTVGRYWTSTVNGIYYSYFLNFNENAFVSSTTRGNGFSVRCVKD
ncbi:hypothetical protein OAV26_03020 [Crocinitomicaceae bacterium]|nr:hypothetical protein [Crocinitomicaceae bacterium]